MVAHLPGMCEVSSSVPSPRKKMCFCAHPCSMQLGNIEIIALLTNFTFGTIYFTSLSFPFLICNVRGFVRGLRTTYVKELEHIIIITPQAAVAIISTLLAMWNSRTTLADPACSEDTLARFVLLLLFLQILSFSP